MRYAAAIAALVVMVFLVIEFNSRMGDLNRLEAERDLVAARLSDTLQKKAALEQALVYATSEAAAEQYGYEKKMVRPGDVLVIPIAPYESTPTPLPAPVVVGSAQETNWQHWLSLFFEASLSAP